MQCHDFAKNRNLRDLNLPVSGLYLLAAPNIPEEARGAVIERGQNGEALSLKEVQRMIEEARERAGVIDEPTLPRKRRCRGMCDHHALTDDLVGCRVS